MNKTIVLKDKRFLNHHTSPGHPESPRRLEAIYEMLKEDGIRGKFFEVQPRPATKEEIALNHSPEYIAKIEKTAGKTFVSLDPDTSTSEGSWEASVLAAGAVLTGLDFILGGKAENGFALVRPPGHHAEESRAMGFCLFNNIAIGARYLLKSCNLHKILIVDWDIHHGNGTQNSFYSSPEVLFFSTHQFPYYPGSGSFEERGTKEGAGFTVNVPLPGGQGDEDYLEIFKEILYPIAEKYMPEFILVSAGYDTFYLDPLGTMKVTPDGYFRLTRSLKELAEKLCDGRLLLTLEGGYHVEGIAESVKYTLLALSGDDTVGKSAKKNASGYKGTGLDIKSTVDKVKKVHSAVWSI